MAREVVIQASRPVAVASAAIWAYLSDPHRLAALNPDSLGIAALQPAGPLQPGQHWQQRTRTPLGVQTLGARVAAADPHSAIVLDGDGPAGTRIRTTVRWTAGGQGCVVQMEHRLTLPRGPLLAAAAGLLAAALRASTATALSRLASALEGTAPEGNASAPA